MIYEGFIINKILSFIRIFKVIYNESVFASIVKKLGERIKEYLSYSHIWSFVKRNDFFTKTWEGSSILKGVEFLLGLPIKICKKAFLKTKDVLYESKIIKLFILILGRYEIILGGFFALMILVPDSRWHSIYGIIIVFALAALLFIKKVVSEAEEISIRGIDFALLIFMLSILMSTITSLFPRLSSKYLILYMTCLLLVLVIVNANKTGRRLNNMVEIFLLGVAATALYGVWQWRSGGIAVNPSVTDVRLNPGLVRIYSTMGNENVFAGLLVISLPLFLGVVFNSKTFIKKAMYTILFGLSFVGIVLTGSRSAWISFAISMFVLLFFKKRSLIPVFIILGILCVPILPAPIYRRVMSIFNSNDKSISTRGMIYKMATPMLKDYYLTGVGLGAETFQNIFQRYQAFGANNYAHTHNLYLQLWLEGGIITVLSFVWMIIRIVKKSLNQIFGQYIDSYTKNILIAALASLAGIMAMGMAEHVLFFNRMLLVFWILIGIILAGLSISINKRRSVTGASG